MKDIIYTILDKAEPVIQKMIGFYSADFQQRLEREPTEKDMEYFRLLITYDLVRALEKYTAPDDKLLSMKLYGSIKGGLNISAFISRNDKSYLLETNAIYAGGHNIQRLHYRYITKTYLPKTNNTAVGDLIQAKIKKMSKIEKINSEINELEKRIKQYENKLAVNEKLSDEMIFDKVKEKQIKNYGHHNFDTTWDTIVSRGATGNFNNDELEFNHRQKLYKQQAINSWKTINIDSIKQAIQSMNKDFQRLTSKLNNL